MPGTGNTGNSGNSGQGYGQGQSGYEREWNDLFPPIDYDALDGHARDAAKIAVDRCWLRDRQCWSDEMRSDFGWWAEELTAAYMAESHALYRLRRMLALLRDPNVSGMLHAAMRG